MWSWQVRQFKQVSCAIEEKTFSFPSLTSARSAGGLENLLHHTGNTPPCRASCDMGDIEGHPQSNTVEAEYLDYCCSVLQHL